MTALLGKQALWRWMIQGGLMLRLNSLSLMTRIGIECQEKQRVCQPGMTLTVKERRQLIDKQLFAQITLFSKKSEITTVMIYIWSYSNEMFLVYSNLLSRQVF